MASLNRRRFLQYAGVSAGTSVLASLPAFAADNFPAKSLSLVVPYPAGGASDTSARIFGESISKSVGQQVVVENYGGGTGLIGANKVLGAPADGYTFFHGSINEVFLAPMLNPAARYKPQDFQLAAPISDANIVLMVRNGIAVDTLDNFLDYAKKSKGKPLTYATVGIDSIYHLMGDALAARLGVPFLHVPYKGGAPALQGLAGGEVDFAILPYQSSFDSMQQQGRLKVLSSFAKALPPALKHIPLISQSRLVPDFEYSIGGGYFVRQGTPASRVAVLRKAIGEALAKPEIRAKLEAEGRTVAQPINSQEQANQVFDQYLGRVTQLIRNVGRKTNAS
ncbi:Tripartite-type tricarboxylate transporter, extracytoplasmic receptor component TctC [Cupriavidus necator]|uniref:Probable extra-cytoplasmic solute receptor n=1 Tax=Cupriavidus necator (strain ATCC 17699 / DSM 428 / KCTC 22496 / NCIMB 10442 / H16 / Stanier 337) TaxID=381666 RepID=Q0K162_CUPNH|nr:MULTISPECIES: tripartite tricarboxylate transporter substrate binding protein [Cupriavidus]EON16224.1 extra-cytoplasmic solute receptor [Cupriavidus sp. GA3-3]QCC04109.1 tripartite tricarboxylate transporter substrate binding protein [Cupriavidus necator H16]QQB78796.1 tripartite tricarboxylate transporter substrate binding protein [Cupriavidus necator]WKA43011.1 tripartite tricarboxylate transporter substrate binding protein [Cupriavidus necator]CAJ96262.1 probable extra-cytoplasmic solute